MVIIPTQEEKEEEIPASSVGLLLVRWACGLHKCILPSRVIILFLSLLCLVLYTQWSNQPTSHQLTISRASMNPSTKQHQLSIQSSTANHQPVHQQVDTQYYYNARRLYRQSIEMESSRHPLFKKPLTPMQFYGSLRVDCCALWRYVTVATTNHHHAV